MKTCTKCGIDKPTEEYHTGKNYVRGYCQSCHRKYHRDWHLKASYGIDQNEYKDILQSQNGKCAICQQPRKEGTRRFHVDHDHSTGAIRGLLCYNCNSGLGRFNDDPALIQQAINYLKR